MSKSRKRKLRRRWLRMSTSRWKKLAKTTKKRRLRRTTKTLGSILSSGIAI